MTITMVILFLCLWPISHSGADLFTYFDKFIHMGMHGTLTFVLMRDLYLVHFYNWTPKDIVARVFCFSFFLGCSIEFLQAWMALGRFFDPYDVMANCVGAGVGIFLGFKVFRSRRK